MKKFRIIKALADDAAAFKLQDGSSVPVSIEADEA